MDGQRIYLNVPYDEKDAAKQLGARFDGNCRRWYYTDPARAEDFKRWTAITIDDLSDEQKELVYRAQNGENVLVDACIGSGKTTTIQVMCSLLENKRILYLTYNKLLRKDAEKKISARNVVVKNYHAFAWSCLRKVGKTAGVSDLLESFNKLHPPVEPFDMLVIDEYQDITEEIANMLTFIKECNPNIQIIAVGDLKQKIYDWTRLYVPGFMETFMGNYTTLSFTKCFRLSPVYGAFLGSIWEKEIVGVNPNCKTMHMSVNNVVRFLSQQNPEDILCLGERGGIITRVLNKLERNYPMRFNKNTVYASIREENGETEIPSTAAIFTTYDGSKGLERKVCVIFNFTEDYWDSRINKPMTKFDILRNIFLVAISRGKEYIIFVDSDKERLSKKTLTTPVALNATFPQPFLVSEMFEYRLQEHVEDCYKLLNIEQLSGCVLSDIGIKAKDGLIDLTPCVGVYQEAMFFQHYDIDEQIRYTQDMHKERPKLKIPEDATVEQKVLYLAAYETCYTRYVTQVQPPFVTDAQRVELFDRLAEDYSPFEDVQEMCEVLCVGKTSLGKCTNLVISGRADVVKDDVVYELKYTSELQHSHFLQAACYMLFLNRKIKYAVLHNVRTGEKYKITIPDVHAFLNAVIKAVTKGALESCETIEGAEDNELLQSIPQGDFVLDADA